MRIFQPALDRLAKAELTGANLIVIAESLLAAINRHELPGGTVNLYYVEEGEQPRPDELVPIVTISLAPVAALVSDDITGRQGDGSEDKG